MEISEFHLSKNVDAGIQDDHVDINDLASTLNSRATHREIGKKLKRIQKKSTTLPKPLEKIHADKVLVILIFSLMLQFTYDIIYLVLL